VFKEHGGAAHGGGGSPKGFREKEGGCNRNREKGGDAVQEKQATTPKKKVTCRISHMFQ